METKSSNSLKALGEYY